MLDFKIKFDERKFEKAVTEEARKGVEDRVRRIRCPVHNRPARIRFTGSSRNLRWMVEGCCQGLISRVIELLNQP